MQKIAFIDGEQVSLQEGRLTHPSARHFRHTVQLHQCEQTGIFFLVLLLLLTTHENGEPCTNQAIQLFQLESRAPYDALVAEHQKCLNASGIERERLTRHLLTLLENLTPESINDRQPAMLREKRELVWAE